MSDEMRESETAERDDEEIGSAEDLELLLNELENSLTGKTDDSLESMNRHCDALTAHLESAAQFKMAEAELRAEAGWVSQEEYAQVCSTLMEAQKERDALRAEIEAVTLEKEKLKATSLMAFSVLRRSANLVYQSR